MIPGMDGLVVRKQIRRLVLPNRQPSRSLNDVLQICDTFWHHRVPRVLQARLMKPLGPFERAIDIDTTENVPRHFRSVALSLSDGVTELLSEALPK